MLLGLYGQGKGKVLTEPREWEDYMTLAVATESTTVWLIT